MALWNASPYICSHSIKALSIPNVISPSACYCTAAVVYTGLRKEPCEPGGNCVKSPCELPVRWLGLQARSQNGEGARGGGRRGGGERRRDGAGGGGGGKPQCWKQAGRQAGRELAGSGCTWGAGFHLAGKNTVSNKGGGWALCLGVIGHFRLDLTSLNKGVFIACLWHSLWTYGGWLSCCDKPFMVFPVAHMWPIVSQKCN